MKTLRRMWEGRMLTQKVLDIEDSLPPYQRQIVYLYYRQGLTQTHIGKMLGITQGSVSRALSRVHAQVHKRYHQKLRQMRENTSFTIRKG